VTRAPKQLRRPAICFGGWWGQPANRTKQAKQNNRRLPGVRITSRPSPGTQAQQAHLNKDRPEAAQRSTAQRGPRGKAGKPMLMPDCLPVGLSCATDYCCNACSVPSPSKPHRVPRPKLRNQTSKKAADRTTMKQHTSFNTNKLNKQDETSMQTTTTHALGNMGRHRATTSNTRGRF
jgi:hypothetical protein